MCCTSGAPPEGPKTVAPSLNVAGTPTGCETYAGLADQVNNVMKDATGAFPCQAAAAVLDCAATFKSIINGHGETVAANLDRAFMRLHAFYHRKTGACMPLRL